MKYSATVDGEVLDFRFKRLAEDHVAFYIGDLSMGQIFKFPRYWSAVCHGECKMRMVKGFKTRLDAATFILESKGIWEPEG